MRLDRRFLNWGLFFIVLGAIPLAVQQGVLGRDLAARAWQLWPLLLVAAGVGLLLRRTAFEFVGGLIVAVTIGAMLGGVIAVGADIGGIARACGSGTDRTFAAQQGTLNSAARVRLDMTCTDATVTTAPGSGWSLTGTSDDGQPPHVDQTVDQLVIRSRDRAGIFFFGAGHRETWALTLPVDPTLSVAATLNAGSATVGLTGATLDRAEFEGNAATFRIDLTNSTVSFVRVNVNAGSARVVLPMASFSGRLEANAGSIRFCVPEGVGLSVSLSSNITGSNNFASRGLVQVGTTWETPGFATAQYRVDLVASANAGSIDLNPEGGCR
jgi:hypothetical protein